MSSIGRACLQVSLRKPRESRSKETGYVWRESGAPPSSWPFHIGSFVPAFDQENPDWQSLNLLPPAFPAAVGGSNLRSVGCYSVY